MVLDDFLDIKYPRVWSGRLQVEFADGDLDRLETEPDYSKGLPSGVVKAFRMRLQYIRAANDERDFYSWKSLHYEKLQGQRQHQHSMRLNDRYRLILELVTDGQDKRVRIVSVEDYH